MVKKFKVGTIVDSADSINTLRGCKNLLGSEILQVRKVVKPFLSEIKNFEEIKNSKIEELGTPDPDKTDSISIRQGTPEFDKILSFVEELSNTEVEIDIKKPIDLNKLLSKEAVTGLSENDITVLEELGILYDSEEVKEKTEEVKKPTESDAAIAKEEEVERSN